MISNCVRAGSLGGFSLTMTCDECGFSRKMDGVSPKAIDQIRDGSWSPENWIYHDKKHWCHKHRNQFEEILNESQETTPEEPERGMSDVQAPQDERGEEPEVNDDEESKTDDPVSEGSDEGDAQ
jgi:hypothetical protein